MPKFKVTLEGYRTTNYTYETVVDAKDEDDAFDQAEQIEPEQKEWVLVDFDKFEDKEIELDGVGDVEEVDEEEQVVETSNPYKKKLEA